MSNSNDFPLVEAPAAGRKGVFSIAMVLALIFLLLQKDPTQA